MVILLTLFIYLFIMGLLTWNFTRVNLKKELTTIALIIAGLAFMIYIR
ncbi:hypothetical protein [Stenotrophomonas phage RAS14]